MMPVRMISRVRLLFFFIFRALLADLRTIRGGSSSVRLNLLLSDPLQRLQISNRRNNMLLEIWSKQIVTLSLLSRNDNILSQQLAFGDSRRRIFSHNRRRVIDHVFGKAKTS